MSEYLVDINHERLSFFTPAGEVKALNDVSIHVKEGEVLGIVGESGSGKSVTAYSLMGLTAYPGKLIGGTLEFNGHKINEMTEKEMRKIRGNEVSIIFQDPMTSLNPVYTIGNQIEEVILLHTDKKKKEAHERAKELLTLVGINEPEKRLKQYPHELSGGMRQRVMIAMALGNIYGGKSADKSPNPDKLYGRILIAAIWIALIPVVGKYIILGISALLIFTVSNNFLIIAAFAACMVLRIADSFFSSCAR